MRDTAAVAVEMLVQVRGSFLALGEVDATVQVISDGDATPDIFVEGGGVAEGDGWRGLRPDECRQLEEDPEFCTAALRAAGLEVA